MSCDKCDGFGSEKTYSHQACLPINGKVVGVDWCIHHIVAALNAAGIETVACCCGHGVLDGHIVLADGRSLLIKRTNHDKELAGKSFAAAFLLALGRKEDAEKFI